MLPPRHINSPFCASLFHFSGLSPATHGAELPLFSNPLMQLPGGLTSRLIAGLCPAVGMTRPLLEHSRWARHCSRCFLYLRSHNPSNKSVRKFLLLSPLEEKTEALRMDQEGWARGPCSRPCSQVSKDTERKQCVCVRRGRGERGAVCRGGWPPPV